MYLKILNYSKFIALPTKKRDEKKQKAIDELIG